MLFCKLPTALYQFYMYLYLNTERSREPPSSSCRNRPGTHIMFFSHYISHYVPGLWSLWAPHCFIQIAAFVSFGNIIGKEMFHNTRMCIIKLQQWYLFHWTILNLNIQYVNIFLRSVLKVCFNWFVYLLLF